MLVAQLTAHALLGGLAMDNLVTLPDVSSNPGLMLRQSGSCDPGEVVCTTGCMPAGNVCCTALYAMASPNFGNAVCRLLMIVHTMPGVVNTASPATTA